MKARCVAVLCACVCSTAFAQEPAPAPPTAPPGEGEKAPTPGVPPVPSGNPAERQAWLRARIDEQLASPGLRGARVGVAVMEVESGRVLYARAEKAAPTGAASLNYNAISVTIAPAPKEGEPARVAVEPQSAYVVVDNHARTAGAGQPALNVAATLRGEQTVLTITGKILKSAEPRTFF